MKYAIYIKCLYKNLPPTALQPIGSFRASLYMIARGGGIPRNLSEKKKKHFHINSPDQKLIFSFLLLKAEIST